MSLGKEILGASAALLLLCCLSACYTGEPGRLNPGMPRVPQWLAGEQHTNRVVSDEELLFGWTPEVLQVNEGEEQSEIATELGPGGLPIISRRLQPVTSAFHDYTKPRRAKPPAPRPGPAGNREADSETPSVTVVIESEDKKDDKKQPKIAGRSRLEEFYFGMVKIVPSRDVRQFGYDFFEPREDLEAAPAELDEQNPPRRPLTNDGAILTARFPIPTQYVVGPGDEIHVRIWGAHEINARELVNHEGQLSLPKIGMLTVAGTTYGDLHGLVKTAFTREIRNFEIEVTLSKLRTIRINLVGEVEMPGLHEVAAGSTVITALTMAGGPKKSGSLRRVVVRRHSGEDIPVDLYDFLLRGDRQSDMILLEQDTIVVPTIKRTVGVGGYVMRPGIYEVIEDPTVDQAIEMGGGLTAFGYSLYGQIERTARNGERIIEDLPLLTDEAKSTLLRDGDLLLIQGVDMRVDNTVDLKGTVVRPGRFQWKPGMYASDLLRMGAGFITDTYFENATVTRILGSAGSYEMVIDRTNLRTSHQIHHLNIRKALAHPHGPDDLQLRPLDSLQVFSQRDVVGYPTVTIRGAVKSPGVYELTTGMRVTDLLRLAGNLESDAYIDQAELVRRIYDEEGMRFDIVHLRFNMREASVDRTRDPYLKNFDELVVRSMSDAHVRVKVSGQVRFPGEYVLPKGSRISDLLIASGGLAEDSDLRAAVFSRDAVRQLQQKRLDDLVRKATREFERAYEAVTMIGRVNESDAAGIALEQDSNHMRQLRTLQATGRIIIDMVQDQFRGKTDDLVLEEGDQLGVPRRNYTVNILGEVFNPTALVWRNGWRVRGYLEEIGGLTTDGDEERTYLVRANGTAISARQIGFDGLLDQPVLPGDTLLVPEAPTERPFFSVMKDAGELALMMGLATQAFKGEGPK